ncbi:MAG: L-aspartate oxidase [Flavobacteriaceae bacterium]|nr:L-aspartate oxidase [Flavobacteriaceae bacterium]MCI5088222.1 L-aspartate oxidase [Flavobacteriaceae bacterium]
MPTDPQTHIHTDSLVIGSGIAGLSFAIKLAINSPEKEVLLLTKRALIETNTKYAQGGIAVVQNFELDSFEKHISDTLIAGDGLCKPEVVSFVVSEGPERLEELVSWGTHFDLAAKAQNSASPFHLGKEGGHSAKRIVHFKDRSGYEIQQSLIAKVKSLPNVRILEDHTLVDLITNHHIGLATTSTGFAEGQNRKDLENALVSESENHTKDKELDSGLTQRNLKENQCYGAYVISQKDAEIIKITAQATILSTGGAGQLYAHTTNPEGASGDGLAAAYRAKVHIEKLPYVQFHPTALALPVRGETFLISEAVRGAGAILKNAAGQAFMAAYDARKDLAPRDVVARAIEIEIKKQDPSENYVYLDATHLGRTAFETEFPNIYKACVSVGIDPLTDYIPVLPAAHYFCGGIGVNAHSQTSLKGLYAIGECSHTGLHGANRLASNSLLEALVFAHRAAEKVAAQLASETADRPFMEALPPWQHVLGDLEKSRKAIRAAKKELQQLMSDKVAIFKTHKGLLEAEKAIAEIYQKSQDWYRHKKLSLEICELRNLANVAYLIVKQSQAITENRGGFYNKDLEKEKT